MKNRLLIWMTILALAFTMSFSTALSFATVEGVSDQPDSSGGSSGTVLDPNGDPDDPNANPVDPGTPTGLGEEDPVVPPATIKEDLQDCDITWPAKVNYNGGEAINAKVTVKLPGGDVVPESDYEVIVGETEVMKSAEISVRAYDESALIQGEVFNTVAIVYPMSKYAKVTLSKTSLPVKFKKNNDWKVIPVVQKPTVKVTNSSTGETMKLNTDYTVKYSNAKSKNAGKYKVTVTAKAGSNYTGSATATYQIKAIKITSTDFFVYGNACYYTGKKLKPKKVMIGAYVPSSKADLDLVKGTHYTVTKAATFSNNKKIGIGDIKITIKGKGNFTGTAQLYGGFEIGPEKAKVKSAKAGKKKVTLKWTKSKHADGYRIEYFGWKGNKSTKTKVVYVKSKKTLKKTIKKLKSGYTYDFWVSSYKTIKGVKYFVYGNAKTVKVK